METGAGQEEPRPLGELLRDRLDAIGEQFRSAAPPPPAAEVVGELLAEGDSPTTGYAARLFAQVALPYRDPGALASWIRRNGLITLTVRPGEWQDPKTGAICLGYPYGALPRLLLTWMTTEAVRTHSRVLHLGHSLYEFTGRIGLNQAEGALGASYRVGGKDGRRLLDQMQRLFHAPITAYDARVPDRQHSKAFFVADEGVLLFDPARPDQAALWGSTVTLSERFFASVVALPVPIDLAALAQLKGSPLRIDIYTWLTYRMHHLPRPTTVPWEALAAQFGGSYQQLRQFRAQFVKQLRLVCIAYPAARVEPTSAGLVLRPSPTHVPKRSAPRREVLDGPR